MKIVRTTTFQLTVLYAVMLAVSTVAVAIFLYWSTIGFLQRQTDATIEVEITGLREQYRVLGLNGLSRVIGSRIRSGDDPEALYLFADRSLRPLAGNMNQWPELVSREDGWYSFTHLRDERTTAARARVLALQEGLVLLVGRDISELDRLLSLVIRAFSWGGGLVIALALAGGLFMSSQVLRRIESINATTRSIITGDLHQRVPTRGTQDEFDQLAGNLNRMLDQIEQLMGGIRHVGDSIAHDLRTPLTRLRHALEQAAAGDDTEDMRTSLQAAIEDADQLLATFSALLRIARLESGSYVDRKETLPLARLVADAMELYGAVAEERHITISSDFDSEIEVPGDRDLVFQLIVNLIDNAVKYTPDGGKLHLAVKMRNDRALVSVADSGPGIPRDHLHKITRRFYRVDESRQRPGSGLGLALVQAVTDYHGADLTFSDNAPGLRVEVAFPAGSDHDK
jgi:signal transduction histidine kinase